MLELQGNIWDYHAAGHWAAITTNGSVNRFCCAVMGRGVALEAAIKYQDLPMLVGRHLTANGNVPACFDQYRIFTLPVKHQWSEKASILLIQDSLALLKQLAEVVDSWPVYLVRPGCGNGGLSWAEVKPKIELLLDDRFVVVERGNP